MPTYSAQTPPISDARTLPPRLRAIAREIAALRGWKDELSIDFEFANVSRIRQALDADLRAQTPARILREQAQFLESLGLVPRKFSLENTLLDAFAPEILGIYSLSWSEILIADNTQSALAESVLRHELVHAYQDRLFHLKQRATWEPYHGDEIAAVHALAEGEAVCNARQLEDPAHQGCFAGSDSAEDRIFERGVTDVPPTIRYGLLAPYADGIRLVRRLLRQGGWPRVDVAWSEGLHSTRELFRNSTEALSEANLPPVFRPSANCTGEFTDVLGEQGLASVLFGSAGLEAARQSASRLVGDRAAYWRCGSTCTAVWQLRTLTEQAAVLLVSDLRLAFRIGVTASDCSAPTCQHIGLSRNLRDIVITSVHSCDPAALEASHFSH